MTRPSAASSTPKKDSMTPDLNGNTSSTRSRGLKRAAADSEELTPTKRSKRHSTNPSPKYADVDSSEDEAKTYEKTIVQKKKAVAVNRKETVATQVVKTKEEKITPSKKAKANAAVKKDQDGWQPLANSEPHTDEDKPQIKPQTKPVKQKRKTKAEKEAEAMPIAARTVGSKLNIGAHVSAAGGVHNAVKNCVHIGGNAFALFLKSQRKWDNPAIKPEHADEFNDLCSHHSFSPNSHVLPHGSYLVNLAQKDPEKAEQAYKSFLDDLKRCERLGIRLYNFHPGNTNGHPREEAITRLASQLNRAHKETKSVVTVLENMAASPTGNTIGGCFEDLRDVIAEIDDKLRVGVCFDTCHAFAAGYNLRDPAEFKKVMVAFDNTVGAKYLMAVHVNDSKAPLGSHRDLHQNIGLGFLGLRAFHNLVNEPRFAGLPLVLETPIDRKNEDGKDVEDKNVWAREIKLLESLVGMDPEGEEFKKMEKGLADQGAEARGKAQKQFDTKMDKVKKKKVKGRNAKKEVGTSDDESDSD